MHKNRGRYKKNNAHGYQLTKEDQRRLSERLWKEIFFHSFLIT